MTTTTSRRRFLKRGLGAAVAAGAAPAFVPARAFGANERIVLGCIGAGVRGTYLVKAFGALADLATGGANIRAGVGMDADAECLHRRTGRPFVVRSARGARDAWRNIVPSGPDGPAPWNYPSRPNPGRETWSCHHVRGTPPIPHGQ